DQDAPGGSSAGGVLRFPLRARSGLPDDAPDADLDALDLSERLDPPGHAVHFESVALGAGIGHVPDDHISPVGPDPVDARHAGHAARRPPCWRRPLGGLPHDQTSRLHPVLLSSTALRIRAAVSSASDTVSSTGSRARYPCGIRVATVIGSSPVPSTVNTRSPDLVRTVPR